MKFSKLMMVMAGIIMTGSLMAVETVKDNVHTTYIGYEFSNSGYQQPSVGHRYQQEGFIFDVNGGYKYQKTCCFPFHIWKTGINTYRVFHQTGEAQFYAGIGTDFVGYKTKNSDGRAIREYALQPSVSIGHDFYIEGNTKIFFELTYKPYEFGKNSNTSIHTTGMRMGVGF